jgi:hypothetical protein
VGDPSCCETPQGGCGSWARKLVRDANEGFDAGVDARALDAGVGASVACSYGRQGGDRPAGWPLRLADAPSSGGSAGLFFLLTAVETIARDASRRQGRDKE